jgi:hypothetical protein
MLKEGEAEADRQSEVKRCEKHDEQQVVRSPATNHTIGGPSP